MPHKLLEGMAMSSMIFDRLSNMHCLITVLLLLLLQASGLHNQVMT